MTVLSVVLLRIGIVVSGKSAVFSISFLSITVLQILYLQTGVLLFLFFCIAD